MVTPAGGSEVEQEYHMDDDMLELLTVNSHLLHVLDGVISHTVACCAHNSHIGMVCRWREKQFRGSHPTCPCPRC